MDTSANQDLIKSINQRLILEKIRKLNVDSVKELAQLTKLSIPAIKKNVDFLVEKGLLIKTGTMDTKMGRKPTKYELDKCFRSIIAIDLGESRVSIALGTLEGGLDKIQYMELLANESGEAFTKRLYLKVNSLLKTSRISNQKIASIVIANPGVVNSKTGTLLFPAQTAVWYNIPLKTVFEERYHVPTIVLNDVNVSAMGEMKYGAGMGLSNCIFIRLDVGIGAGIVINGELFEGFHSAAGEIGFSVISLNKGFAPDKDDQYADKWLTTSALIQRIKQKALVNPGSLLFKAIEGHVSKINLKLIAEFWDVDAQVHDELVEFIRLLGMLISNITAVLDMPVVIIGGEAIKLGPRMLSELQNVVSELSVFPPQLMFATSGSESALFGAVAIGVQYYFDNLEL